MANEPILTVVGNLADDPDLRFTGGGKAVANFRIASTPRVKDGDQWVDGEPLWLACSAWAQLAENVAESLTKGMQVIVQGRLRNRSWEDRDGNKRTTLELEVDHVGPSLQWAMAKVTRAARTGGNYSGQQRQQSRPQSDPWAAPAGSPAGDPWSTPSSDDHPPF